MKRKHKQSGFTLVELLMALMVGSIVLAAAATMADAMSCGKQATEQMTRTATYLAQLHMRLSDLVMRANSIETISDGAKEGVKVVCEEGIFTIYTDIAKNILYVQKEGEESYKYDYKVADKITLMPVSVQENVEINYDSVNRVVITFDITENGASQTYTMTAARRGGE